MSVNGVEKNVIGKILGTGDENADKQPVKSWRDDLRASNVHTYAKEHPNINLQTSGASIW